MRRTTGTRLGKGLGALIATATAAVGLATTPAAATPAAATPATATPAAPAASGQTVQPGQTCTTADLGKRHPIIKSTEVAPTITHFKGWYVTQGSTGYQNVTTSTQTTIAVSVGLNGEIKGDFAVEALGTVGAMLGLNVQVNYSSTSSESTSVSWNFNDPGYYGVYKGTKKVTGTYGSLNCNRVQQGDGSWALKWIEGPDSGSYTTYTTLEEGAVRCEDKVPANSIMRKAQGLLDCETPARAGHAPGPVASADATAARNTAAKNTAEDTAKDTAGKAATAQTSAPATRAALNCQPDVYRIHVPGKPLNWSAPLLANDGIRLRESNWTSAHLDNWRLCNVTERNGVIEASLWNWGNGGCATIPAGIANQDQAYLTTAPCGEDDLQRFYIYRDVPGSSKIGLQNKYTGSMLGHDRYANGELIRQYSSGRQDGTGTYDLVKV